MSNNNAPLLRVEDVVVEFPTRRGVLRALDHVSFEIGRGEVLGIVGESGAGKSVTGSTIIGLIDPPGRLASGRIYLDGARIDGLSENAMRDVRGKRIGMVFQDPLTSLNPLYTVGRQLTETIQTHTDLDAPEARERAIDLLRAVGIPAPERRIDDHPHRFSGGMRQRVVIALALCAEPSLVIADEPTTALDVSIQAQIIAVLKRMCRQRSAAIMLITHDMGVIAETADRVAVMYAGKIVETGPVADIIHAPSHPYTQGLMSCIPKLGAGHERLAQIDGAMPRLTDRIGGCAFHPRCPHATDRCRRDTPPLIDRGGHMAACWLLPEAIAHG
jgi:peptide/nickel transport system ATP-binding protein